VVRRRVAATVIKTKVRQKDHRVPWAFVSDSYAARAYCPGGRLYAGRNRPFGRRFTVTPAVRRQYGLKYGKTLGS